jgi:hypothetical protein
VQAAQLQYDEEQEEDDRATGVFEILSLLPQAHGSSGVEVMGISHCGLRIAECGFQIAPIRNPRCAIRNELGQ